MTSAETADQNKLSFERRLRMQEAREAIIDRLARDLPTNIDLERYLNVVVSEIGKMLDADRCDLLQLGGEKELYISHEWRRDKSVPKSEGTKIPFDTEKLSVARCGSRTLSGLNEMFRFALDVHGPVHELRCASLPSCDIRQSRAAPVLVANRSRIEAASAWSAVVAGL
jgi:GAF domain-containing protein